MNHRSSRDLNFTFWTGFETRPIPKFGFDGLREALTGWGRNMEYAFITGMGRSGTAFVPRLLNSAGSCSAHHEYIGDREFWLLSWYLERSDYTVPYLCNTKNRIENSARDGLFVDVNGYLHHAIPGLRKVFRPINVFHLVRDGRSVVRSIYSRRDSREINIVPKTASALREWQNWGKFEKICWNWADTTLRLVSQNTELLQFEKLVSDYDYVKTRLLEPLGLSLSHAKWKSLKARKVNQTQPRLIRQLRALKNHRPFISDELPGYESWQPWQQEKFWRICGAAMKAAKYGEPGEKPDIRKESALLDHSEQGA